jgi:putative transposase
MPSRNTLKEFAPQQYYHLYNRGVEKRPIFLDDQDYLVFLGLLKRYLSGENHNKNNRHTFSLLTDKVQLLAYCLMPNHFHLLLYQESEDGITQLMRRVSTGYVMYFNNRYQRVGGLFQGRYKASLINKDAYLHHISRYIHLNPSNYQSYKFSSLQYYMGKKQASWVQTKPILDLFEGDMQQYRQFLADYQEAKREIDILKWQLANINEL